MAGHKNTILNLHNTSEAISNLRAIVAATHGKGEGRIKCTVTKHRVAKTAILLGIAILSKKPPSTALEYIKKWAPKQRWIGRTKVKVNLVLECASTQGLLESVDRTWKKVNEMEAVSHRKVMTAALCIGLDSLTKVDSGKVRLLISKLSPVPFKYWDPELDQWL